MELLSSTQKLLDDTPQSVKTIAKGAKVNYRWLRYFMDGRYNDPGVRKIQRIHDYLSCEGPIDSNTDNKSIG